MRQRPKNRFRLAPTSTPKPSSWAASHSSSRCDEQREVVRRVLPEADAGVDVDLVDAELARGPGGGEDVVAHDLGRRPGPIGSRRRGPRGSPGGAWRPSPPRARRRARTSAPETSLSSVAPAATAARATPGLTVSTETRPRAGEACDDRHHPGELVGLWDRGGAWPRRLAPDVDDRRALLCECQAACDRAAALGRSRVRRTSPASR